MDATVEQTDGYRFVYTLPLSERDLLVEDTYYSDTRALDKAAVKQRIAFYASTPAYKGVLDLHGWGELQPEMNRLSKQGAWVEMGDLITDEILEEFAIVAEPHRVAGALKDGSIELAATWTPRVTGLLISNIGGLINTFILPRLEVAGRLREEVTAMGTPISAKTTQAKGIANFL